MIYRMLSLAENTVIMCDHHEYRVAITNVSTELLLKWKMKWIPHCVQQSPELVTITNGSTELIHMTLRH